jgi:hypothetical protein
MVLFSGMERTSHWAALYFVALMTFGNYVLFNLLVAILVEGFSNQVARSGGCSDAVHPVWLYLAREDAVRRILFALYKRLTKFVKILIFPVSSNPFIVVLIVANIREVSFGSLFFCMSRMTYSRVM